MATIATQVETAALQTPQQRSDEARQIRVTAADTDHSKPTPPQHPNGDDTLYASERHYASHTKGLPHNQWGEVDPAAYNLLLHALDTGAPADFDAIPLGWPKGTSQSKLVDPQCGLGFDLECPDSHMYNLPAPPKFSSKEEIAEIAENYWMALARDTAFVNYTSTNQLIADAAADLSQYADFKGPKENGKVTPSTLFRGFTKGDAMGPYLSQFLLHDIPYGSQLTPARVNFGFDNKMNYLTNPADWLDVQNGKDPGVAPGPIANPLHLFNGRQLAQYVHIDELFQAYLNACLLLITPAPRGGFNAPIDEGNPYKGYDAATKMPRYSNQAGFGTLGEPNFKTLVAEVATRALKAAWYQKWYVNRRLRPEVFAGRIHHSLKSGRTYQFDGPEFAKLKTGVLGRILTANNQQSYLLPMAYPEGCPLHPAYAAGHATVAGACVTVLKAIFYEDITLKELNLPVLEPSADGKTLQPYTGPDSASLTIGGELNKLASNIGLSRNHAGVHWRTDYTASLLLGEMVAIDFLKEMIKTYNENVSFHIRRFDNSEITITK